MIFNFKDQVVFVTGGSRGIGRSIVESFAKAGATCIFTYASSSGAANQLSRFLADVGAKAIGYQVDVCNTEAMAELISKVHKEFGRIDVLVNNAGIIRDTLIMMMGKDDWNDVITTNLNGVYNTVKPISKIMMKQRKGVIINLSSIAAAKPGRGHSNYAASKGAIESLTRALAAELGARGIRVNAVAPGMIETDMSQAVRDAAGDVVLESISLKRFGTVDDIANAVLFLASDLASYITGEVLGVDGGL